MLYKFVLLCLFWIEIFWVPKHGMEFSKLNAKIIFMFTPLLYCHFGFAISLARPTVCQCSSCVVLVPITFSKWSWAPITGVTFNEHSTHFSAYYTPSRGFFSGMPQVIQGRACFGQFINCQPWVIPYKITLIMPKVFKKCWSFILKACASRY